MTRQLKVEIINASNQDGELFDVTIGGDLNQGQKSMAVGEKWSPTLIADADGNYSFMMEARAIRATPEATLFRLRMALTPDVLARLAELGDAENIIRELAGFPPVERRPVMEPEPEPSPEVFDPGFQEDEGN